MQLGLSTNEMTRKLGEGNLIQINTGKIVKKLVNKTITSTKAEKNSSPEKSVHTPPLPKQNKSGNNHNFNWSGNIFASHL